MEYAVTDQYGTTKTLHFEGVKAKLQTTDTAQTRKNVDDLWQIERTGVATIQNYRIERIV